MRSFHEYIWCLFAKFGVFKQKLEIVYQSKNYKFCTDKKFLFIMDNMKFVLGQILIPFSLCWWKNISIIDWKIPKLVWNIKWLYTHVVILGLKSFSQKIWKKRVYSLWLNINTSFLTPWTFLAQPMALKRGATVH